MGMRRILPFLPLVIVPALLFYYTPLDLQRLAGPTKSSVAFNVPLRTTPHDTAAFPSYVLTGQKTHSFRDNLRKDMFYITSGASGGFTNVFITYSNLLYMSILSNRVPIIPGFGTTEHNSNLTIPVPFSEVFDLPRARAALHLPIIEWKDLKILPLTHIPNRVDMPPADTLGCWGAAATESAILEWGLDPDYMNLDISYTKIPYNDYYRFPSNWVNLVSITQLIHPKDHTTDSLPVYMSGQTHAQAPDTQIACFDSLYYALSSSRAGSEWETRFSPVWIFVARHLQFTQRIMGIAEEYVLQAFGLGMTAEVPKFITIHVRRGDFAAFCKDPTDCFAPLSAYRDMVKEIQDEMMANGQEVVRDVILTSDEKDPSFWSEVESLGWKHVDHDALHTEERFGDWYLTIIDAAIQSMGRGFVGTAGSTVSYTSARRVEDWNYGPSRLVHWIH